LINQSKKLHSLIVKIHCHSEQEDNDFLLLIIIPKIQFHHLIVKFIYQLKQYTQQRFIQPLTHLMILPSSTYWGVALQFKTKQNLYRRDGSSKWSPQMKWIYSIYGKQSGINSFLWHFIKVTMINQTTYTFKNYPILKTNFRC